MVGNDAGNSGEKRSPSSGDDLSERLRNLETALKRAQPERAGGDGRSPAGSSTQGMAQALRLASEFAAGVVVGGGIGWVIDRLFGVSPWGLIIFVLLGFAAGVLNVMRSAGISSAPAENSGRASEEVEHGNGSDPSV